MKKNLTLLEQLLDNGYLDDLLLNASDILSFSIGSHVYSKIILDEVMSTDLEAAFGGTLPSEEEFCDTYFSGAAIFQRGATPQALKLSYTYSLKEDTLPLGEHSGEEIINVGDLSKLSAKVLSKLAFKQVESKLIR